MAIRITDDCIICNSCVSECPNNAIYEPGIEWTISDGTSIETGYKLMNGEIVLPKIKQPPISNDYYYIVPDKCTECQGFHDEPQCAAVCPVDCCVPDDMYRETVDELMEKKERLHV